ncbi:MAG TPA: CHAD domain-containing protein, partial [Candidatus Nitrosotenuis sp.]|nr:CHAD domain-containing protein [Candidatus Nitrosotenuis sp.]
MPSRYSKPARRKLGFAHWMRRVPARVLEAAAGLTPDAVHDLRVAIRRCRSMADGLMTMDPDPTWPEMRRAGKKLFRRLGDLRDVQVMLHWIEQLAPPEDVLGRTLRDALLLREAALKEKAAAAVLRFDRQRWKAWGRHLASRAERIPLDSLAYQHLALERWHEARALHRRALRDRSQAGWHALRIGIKRFRYTVENFLPSSHDAWGEDLKRLQDL